MALVDIAAKQKNDELFDDALRVAQAINDTGNRTSALDEIANNLAAAGNIAKALAIAQSQPDSSAEISNIVGVVATSGNIEEAIKLIPMLK